MAKMPTRLKVDRFPKNGRPASGSEGVNSKNTSGVSVFSPNSTKGKGFAPTSYGLGGSGKLAISTPGAKVTKNASAHVPEQGKRSVPKGQWSSNKGGQGESLPKFGMSKGSGHLAKGGPMHEQPTKGHEVGNRPKGSVPTGEHYSAGHREPRTHDEFHRLGNPKGGY